MLVLPSRSEARSNSLMEAMACGCCPVASRVGGNPELVTHGETGLLFASGDEADLARQLELAIADHALRERLGAAAAHKIVNGFSLELAGRAMEAVYGVAGFSVADAFVDRGEGFLVLFVEDRSRIFEVDFLGLCHTP